MLHRFMVRLFAPDTDTTAQTRHGPANNQGGDTETMQRINAAHDTIIRQAKVRR